MQHRERLYSAFGDILSACHHAHPRIVALIFIDEEGECIDLSAGTMNSYVAKVIGAAMRVLESLATQSSRNCQLGELEWFLIDTTEIEMVVMSVSPEYAIVACLPVGCCDSFLIRVLEQLSVELRFECGVNFCLDKSPEDRLDVAVKLRRSRVWGYAPVAFRVLGHGETSAVSMTQSKTQQGISRVFIGDLDHRSKRFGWLEIVDVMGRWHEPLHDCGHPAFCYRVRTKSHDEVSLIEDLSEHRWWLW